jgi:broad specificity phosphatase PhoE
MSSNKHTLPLVYLARHGETAWTISGQYTGSTDLPLTERGERNARRLGERLKGLTVASVFTSPLQRAMRTCELAGFGHDAVIDHDLVEWNYGSYDGMTTEEIHQQRPDWEIFREGCPGGESLMDVAVRANRVVDRLRALDGDALLFSSSHFLRVFVACWLGLTPLSGRHFFLGTSALSTVGYDHGRQDPVVRLWNDCGHDGV